jgi:hypothetical protein
MAASSTRWNSHPRGTCTWCSMHSSLSPPLLSYLLPRSSSVCSSSSLTSSTALVPCRTSSHPPWLLLSGYVGGLLSPGALARIHLPWIGRCCLPWGRWIWTPPAQPVVIGPQSCLGLQAWPLYPLPLWWRSRTLPLFTQLRPRIHPWPWASPPHPSPWCPLGCLPRAVCPLSWIHPCLPMWLPRPSVWVGPSGLPPLHPW